MSKKSLTDVDQYEFKLSKDLEEQATIELRETKDTRDLALQATRNWIDSNPRIELTRMGKFFEHIKT